MSWGNWKVPTVCSLKCSTAHSWGYAVSSVLTYLSAKQFSLRSLWKLSILPLVNNWNRLLVQGQISVGVQICICWRLVLLVFELFFMRSEGKGISTQLPRQRWCSSASRVRIRHHNKLWMFPGNLSYAICASCSLPLNTPSVPKGTGKPISISYERDWSKVSQGLPCFH